MEDKTAAEVEPGTPLVSIIVVSHNYARFLAQAIESALGQTYPRCEVIVIDDGSTDESVEVARRYADRIRLVTQANAGVERTCNRAVGLAAGDYFVRLDADDVLEPTHVEKLWGALRRSPDAAYAYCRPRFFGAESGAMRCFPFSAYLLAKRSNFVHPTALALRDDFLAVGGYAEDLGEHALEDWDLWLRLLARGRRGTYVRTLEVHWRRHPEGSRNPESGLRKHRALAFIRERNRDLRSGMDDRRGRVFYALDFAVSALDVLAGFSRSSRATQMVERASWRRYCRWHAPQRESADSVESGG